MNQAIAARSAFFWLFQRITGVFLAVFLFTHIKVLHWDFDFSKNLIDFSFVIGRLQGNIGWVIFYFFFIISVLFHSLNGFWAVILDFRPSKRVQVIWLSVLWAMGILTAFWAFATLRGFYIGGGVA
jgi:succinate dehydrogenase hydrophobic anchor subunit